MIRAFAAIVIIVAVYALAAPVVAPSLAPERGVSVLFVGDLMLDRSVARAAVATGAGSLFATSTRELFAKADLRVANLEGSVTNNRSIAQRNNKILRFTFEPALARQVLKLLGVSAVSQANNHALDFGDDGYLQTLNNLGQFGVASFGHPLNNQHLSSVLNVRGKKFCLVGYHGLFAASTVSVVNEIQSIHSVCWRTIVFAHWGVEYKAVANTAQQIAAHEFVDAGADLVVGAHPHVVQNYEIYNGKGIFYSLGNFMFDQDFSAATTRGLAIQATFFEHKTQFKLVPITIEGERSSVAEGPAPTFTVGGP